ncbi:MAG: hypothetical protein LUD17_16350 [Bacteroidales bacterium]|nr:hypothetical protein [Bacteroidales bacterium]
MKKIFYYMAALAVSASMAACSDDDDPKTDNGGTEETDATEALLATAIDHFVTRTVVPTYKSLADASMDIVEACEAMEDAYGNATSVASYGRQAAQAWIDAREYWELSEAFLFGAATKYGIDPHIDSWPLNYDQLAATLADEKVMSQMDDDYVVSNLGSGLLGFHALEYMLFADGSVRDASKLSKEELIYTAAVARDLRNHCIKLEAAWSPSGVTSAKQAILEDAEMEPDDNFGEYMQLAGQAGSIYKSRRSACEEILQGCIDIADEVANTKIFSAYSSEDEDYIESPHSKNSQKDFADNIRSIRNAYCGTNTGDGSVSTVLKTINADLDAEIISAISTAISAIESAKGPFVDNINDATWGVAIDKCNDLRDILEEALSVL